MVHFSVEGVLVFLAVGIAALLFGGLTVVASKVQEDRIIGGFFAGMGLVTIAVTFWLLGGL